MSNPPVIALRTQGRSRVSNNSTLWLDERAVDGRSKAARRFRDIYSEIISDLGGDELCLSAGQRQLARRCSGMAVQCELIEGRMVAGEEFDLDTYGTLTDRLGRAFQRLGLKRVKRDREPTLAEIVGKYRTDLQNPPELRSRLRALPQRRTAFRAHRRLLRLATTFLSRKVRRNERASPKPSSRSRRRCR